MVRAAVDRGTARTRHPDTVAIDAGVQVATAAVLLEEGIEGVEEHHVNIDLARYGLSSRRQALKRAKRDLGVESVRVFDKKTKCFEWRMRLPGSKRSKDVIKRLKRVS